MHFEFATATRIIFGPGGSRQAGSLAKEFGRVPLGGTGREMRRAEPLLTDLRERGLEPIAFSVSGEPEVQTVMESVKLGRQHKCDLVIGFGGGSTLDAGKAIA